MTDDATTDRQRPHRFAGFARARPKLTAALLVAVLVIGSAGTLQSYRLVVASTAQADYDSALAVSLAAQTTATATVASAQSVLADAGQVLSSSAGRVLDEAPRTTLAGALGQAEADLRAAQDQLAQADRGDLATEADASFFAPGSGLRASTAALAGRSFDAADRLAGIADTLASPVQAVTDAVALWQAEHDRVVAARYSNNTHAAGWYPELDQCIGSVDITAHYGVNTIAEHWSCGGRDFPDEAGTIITLTGLHAGTYRVDGIVAMLNASRNSPSDLPLGHDLLYQTCQNGQSSTMSFTALTRLDEEPGSSAAATG